MEKTVSLVLALMMLMFVPVASFMSFATTTTSAVEIDEAIEAEEWNVEEEIYEGGVVASFDDLGFSLQVPEGWELSVWRYDDEENTDIRFLSGGFYPADNSSDGYADFAMYYFSPEYMDADGVVEMLDSMLTGYLDEAQETTEKQLGDLTFRTATVEEYEMAVAGMTSGQYAFLFSAAPSTDEDVLAQFDAILASLKIDAVAVEAK